MKTKTAHRSAAIALVGWLSLACQPSARAQSTNEVAEPVAGSPTVSKAELAKELQNPVGGLISVPLESRVDVGPGSTRRYTFNLQPVIPFEVTPDWLLVSRTILPFIYAPKPAGGDPDFDEPGESPVGKGPSVGGIGDITQSFFLAPKEPTDGLIWGVGPVLRLPTASRDAFGQGRWGAGPTGVAMRQDGPWSYGLLANHIWSFAGWGPKNVNMTYLQPFLAYTTDAQTTFGLGSETVYDWTGCQWVVPVDLSISQLVEIGNLPVSIGLGGRLYAQRPDGGPDWGLTLTVTFVFPK